MATPIDQQILEDMFLEVQLFTSTRQTYEFETEEARRVVEAIHAAIAAVRMPAEMNPTETAEYIRRTCFIVTKAFVDAAHHNPIRIPGHDYEQFASALRVMRGINVTYPEAYPLLERLPQISVALTQMLAWITAYQAAALLHMRTETQIMNIRLEIALGRRPRNELQLTKQYMKSEDQRIRAEREEWIIDHINMRTQVGDARKLFSTMLARTPFPDLEEWHAADATNERFLSPTMTSRLFAAIAQNDEHEAREAVGQILHDLAETAEQRIPAMIEDMSERFDTKLKAVRTIEQVADMRLQELLHQQQTDEAIRSNTCLRCGLECKNFEDLEERVRDGLARDHSAGVAKRRRRS